MRENGTASDRPLDNVIVKRMQGFLHMNKLKKEALKVMAAGMSPEEIAGLRSLFQVDLTVPSQEAPIMAYSRISLQERSWCPGISLLLEIALVQYLPTRATC